MLKEVNTIKNNKTKLAGDLYTQTDCYIYISHLDEDYQYWMLPTIPDSVTDSMSSSFAQTNALGRSAPIYTYNNSGPRTVQINLKLHREMMNDINYNAVDNNVELYDNEDYVDALIRALQSISLPKYNLSNKAVEPPLVALRLGKEIFIKGIVDGQIGLTYNKPILYNDKYAEVNLSLTVSETTPYDSTTVFTNGSFRGITNTLRKGMNVEGD